VAPGVAGAHRGIQVVLGGCVSQGGGFPASHTVGLAGPCHSTFFPHLLPCLLGKAMNTFLSRVCALGQSINSPQQKIKWMLHRLELPSSHNSLYSTIEARAN